MTGSSELVQVFSNRYTHKCSRLRPNTAVQHHTGTLTLSSLILVTMLPVAACTDDTATFVTWQGCFASDFEVNWPATSGSTLYSPVEVTRKYSEDSVYLRF
jgi:hypothetical protein